MAAMSALCIFNFKVWVGIWTSLEDTFPHLCCFTQFLGYDYFHYVIYNPCPYLCGDLAIKWLSVMAYTRISALFVEILRI